MRERGSYNVIIVCIFSLFLFSCVVLVEKRVRQEEDVDFMDFSNGKFLLFFAIRNVFMG